ncbi:MAG: hypothetical protein ABL966_10220, partial [Acidimicrobiales bacterium]
VLAPTEFPTAEEIEEREAAEAAAAADADDDGSALPWILGGIAVLLALVPTEIAGRKGRSRLGFFLFGLVLFLPAVIVALIISPDPQAVDRPRQ